MNPFQTQAKGKNKKQKNALQAVLDDIEEDKQPLYQIVSQAQKSLKHDELAENIFNALEEEELQPAVDIQPMYYCLDCHKKLCKVCYQEMHANHECCVTEPVSFICEHSRAQQI